MIEDAPDDELAQRYASTAITHGEATEPADVERGNEAAAEIAAIYRELRQRGAKSQAVLLPFLDHINAHVRGWAAAHALEFVPALGEATLSQLARGKRGMVRFNAEMTLREWRAGRLRFP